MNNIAVTDRIKNFEADRIEIQKQIEKKREEVQLLRNEERALNTMISALQRLVSPNRLRPGRGKQQEGAE